MINFFDVMNFQFSKVTKFATLEMFTFLLIAFFILNAAFNPE